MIAIAEPFFHSLVLVFLEARDGALAYSGSCRRACRGRYDCSNGYSIATTTTTSMVAEEQAGEGMQRIRRISKLPEGIFSSESSSMLVEWEGKVSQSWQRLDLLYVPSRTHTVFVSCNVAYKAWDNGSDNGRSGNNGNRGGDHDNAHHNNRSSILMCEEGGLLILDEGRRRQLPRLVIASSLVRDNKNQDITGVRPPGPVAVIPAAAPVCAEAEQG